MSFRTRLLLFFVLIVVVPMVSLAFVLFRLIADNENGKADAGLAARQETAIGLVEQARAAAERGTRAVGRDVALSTALQRGRTGVANRRAETLLGSLELKRIVIGPDGGLPRVDVGGRTAIIPAKRLLQDASGRAFGTLQVSARGPKAYVRDLKRLTGLEVVVRRDGRLLASTSREAGAADLPGSRGDVELASGVFRASTFVAPAFDGSRLTVSVLAASAPTSRDIKRSRLFAGGILLGFFILAFTFAVLVSRSLQRQIGGFLAAARRLSGGDFSAKVPIAGHDEFAELGNEFNTMSAELQQRLEDLQSERARLAEAMRRIGETFASNLDRDGLVQIVLRTALDGAGAAGGRAALRDEPEAPLRTVAEAGRLGGLEPALAAAQAESLQAGLPVQVQRAGAHALGHPLRTVKGEATVTGVLAVARTDRPFSATERELFEYLAQQAAVSIENVGLHETIELQAVTDELTGLANRRQFKESLPGEVERSRRFDAPVALVMLDLDDFKRVNDTLGHQAGDRVLREVGKILRDSSREIDTPARYGGEEMAMVLPGTDLEGAYKLAERVRREIEELAITLPGGVELRVTASFGVATHPECAHGADALVAAADAALYEAKRAGKNRTVRAPRRPQA